MNFNVNSINFDNIGKKYNMKSNFTKKFLCQIEEFDYSSLPSVDYLETKNDSAIFPSIMNFIFDDNNDASSDSGTTRFWSSWWGSEAESTDDFVSKLYDSLATKEKINSKRLKDLGKSLSDQKNNTFKGDKNYKMGSKWKYGSVNIIDKKVSAEDSLVTLGEVEGKYGSARADLLYGKATGRVQVGFDHVKISGEAEASAVHLEAETSGTKEIKGYNIVSGFSSVKSDLGHVYAKGDIGAGFYKGEDGKMHLDSGVKAEVGADLCSASVKGGASVLGVGAVGEVKVKIGVGLQLNAGLQDGKLNLKIGAAVGVGIELGASLDIGGAIDMVFL